MGGTVSLTLRFSKDEQFRGGCWTNILPNGLFDSPFYDPDLSVGIAHSRQWLSSLLEARRTDPEVGDMWNGIGMCAPYGYGIVIVDYVTSLFISIQGYTDPTKIVTFGDDDPYNLDKWRDLQLLGVLQEQAWDPPNPPARWKVARLTLPFNTTIVGDEGLLSQEIVDLVDRSLGLSGEERAYWESFIREWCYA